jgi:hypothetical protein
VRLEKKSLEITRNLIKRMKDDTEASVSIEAAMNLVDTIEALQQENEQLRELANAKADGRLVVLPCKVGDIVYEITDCFDSGIGCKGNCDECPKQRQIIEITVRTKAHAVRIVEHGLVGKTVFLTREAAEKAIGGETERGKEG